MRFSSALFSAALLSGSALASDFTVPTGFNLESAGSSGPVAGVLLDGRILIATGSFGAEGLAVLHPDGSATPFATGFGSLAGVAQSPITGDIVVGDSLFAPALTVLRDFDNNGDALGAGEHLPHVAQPGPVGAGPAPLPFNLSFKPGTDELFMTGSTPFDPMMASTGLVSRFVGGVENLYADGMGFASGMTWDGDDLYVADLNSSTFFGRVVTLTDGNADGDALDAGEAVDFAAGLSGASGLVQAKDGHFYLSGVSDVLVGGDFSGAIARLAPDGDNDGITDEYIEAYIDGFAFAGALTLVEGVNGFEPGVDGDGQLYVGDYTFPGGNRIVRSAPNASTSVVGAVANNSMFSIVVSGDVGAAGFHIISLDTTPTTISGIGDLCTGFNGAFLIAQPQVIGASGSVSRTITVHGQPALVGLDVAIQGIVFQAGDYGLGNPLEFTIAP